MSSQMTAANFGTGRGGFGEQVGHAAVAGDPGVGEGPVGLALGAGLQVQAAGLDVPVDGGDEPARRQPVLGGAQLPAQRRAGVLHLQGGGPAQERDRDRLGRGAAAGPGGGGRHDGGLCWRCH